MAQRNTPDAASKERSYVLTFDDGMGYHLKRKVEAAIDLARSNIVLGSREGVMDVMADVFSRDRSRLVQSITIPANIVSELFHATRDSLTILGVELLLNEEDGTIIAAKTQKIRKLASTPPEVQPTLARQPYVPTSPDRSDHPGETYVRDTGGRIEYV